MAFKRWILACSLATMACGGRVGTTPDYQPTEPSEPVTRPDVADPNDEDDFWRSPSPPGEVGFIPNEDTVPIAAETSSRSMCASAIPAGPSSACAINTPQGGRTIYVSSRTGSDSYPGNSASPFATLHAALIAASEGATILVAEGDYQDAEIIVDAGITMKGGFDASFFDWNPEQHPSRVYGQLTLSNDNAVVGGFRFIGHGTAATNGSAFHRISAGALVRNHIEVVYEAEPGAWGTYAIVPSAEAGHTTRLSCNDIYVRQTGSMAILEAIEYGNVALHAGESVLEYNRVCNDSDEMQIASALSGYGTCENGKGPASITARNNVFEVARHTSGAAVSFYDCDMAYGMNLDFDQNTFISAASGIDASGSTDKLAYTFTNNIFYGRDGSNEAVSTPITGKAQNNLVFGFSDSTFPLEPSATQRTMTASEVFVDPDHGNDTPLSTARGAQIPK